MAKRKRSKNTKGDIIQLQDCSKNMECGVSIADDIKVIVFYNGTNYKVKVVIPKKIIVRDIIKAQNSKFDLFLNFHDTDYSNSSGHLYIEVNCKYKIADLRKKPHECEAVRVAIKAKRYHGNIILQPEFFIPEEWSSMVNSFEDEIFGRKLKKEINSMKMNSTQYTNYTQNNVVHPYQGGDCTGGR